MTATFAGNLSTPLDQVRNNIGDTALNTGVLPGGANFSDELINAALAAQGSVGAASAWLLRRAILRWGLIAESRTVGSRSETNRQAANLTALLGQIEQEYGVGSGLQAGAIDLDFIEKDA